MTNLEWLYEHDEYFNSFAKLIAFLRGFATDEFTANEWLRQEHSEPNPDCSAMLYKTFTGNMCSHYEPKDGVVAILREAARNLSDYHDAGEALRRLTDTLNIYHALETLADMIERDYVRRESIEEVMDNDRALVKENSMLARELLKLRAELEKATNNLNSANKDFENARAELTAERDNLKANNEQLHTLAGEQAAKIDELASQGRKMSTELANMQERIIKLKDERDKAREESVELYSDLVKASDEREHYREKCSKMATIIHDALMVMDEGMA